MQLSGSWGCTFKQRNRRTLYLTEDLPGLRLVEQTNNNSGILALGREKIKDSVTDEAEMKSTS